MISVAVSSRRMSPGNVTRINVVALVILLGAIAARAWADADREAIRCRWS